MFIFGATEVQLYGHEKSQRWALSRPEMHSLALKNVLYVISVVQETFVLAGWSWELRFPASVPVSLVDSLDKLLCLSFPSVKRVDNTPLARDSCNSVH